VKPVHKANDLVRQQGLKERLAHEDPLLVDHKLHQHELQPHRIENSSHCVLLLPETADPAHHRPSSILQHILLILCNISIPFHIIPDSLEALLWMPARVPTKLVQNPNKIGSMVQRRQHFHFDNICTKLIPLLQTQPIVQQPMQLETVAAAEEDELPLLVAAVAVGLEVGVGVGQS
jgi:hypothetical protein